MDRRTIAVAIFALLGACGKADTTVANTEHKAPPAVENRTAPLVPPTPGTPGGLPDDRTPLEEPKGPIDPKSAEAAGQVMQQYGALLEERSFGEAYRLWWPDGGASNLTEAQFAAQFSKYSEIHAQVGKPGDMEGAAGSSYVTVPFVLYGRARAGSAFNQSGTATLRRVNDVPGSSEAQRRWHIERIEFGGAG